MNTSENPSAFKSPTLGPHGQNVSAFAASDTSRNEPFPWFSKSAFPKRLVPLVPRKSSGHVMRLFENPGHGNDWIAVRLTGVKSNRAAIGARIKVTVENEGRGTRSIYRTVGSGGSFGASPLEQHIGLGKSARIQDLEIWWPASNNRQHFGGVGKNQAIEIAELVSEVKRVDRRQVRLGGSKRTE